ncbi:MAG: sulfurtransferase TusA family protein [Neisseriaceae bacterium]
MKVIDLKGLKCPIPILKTKKALTGLHSGEKLCILTTDEQAPADFRYFCHQTGHTLQSSRRIDDLYFEIVISHR